MFEYVQLAREGTATHPYGDNRGQKVMGIKSSSVLRISLARFHCMFDRERNARVQTLAEFDTGHRSMNGLTLLLTSDALNHLVKDAPLKKKHNHIRIPHFSFVQLSGIGTFFSQTGTYVGEWRYGLQNGNGTALYNNGNKYAGQFVNGYKEGYGEFTVINGDR